MSDPYRLLTTGSRFSRDWHLVGGVLAEELITQPFGTTFIVVHGACPPRSDGTPGVDMIVDRWGHSEVIAKLFPEYTILVEAHPADWDRPCTAECYHRPRYHNGKPFCPVAGNYRNQDMVDLGANKCVGFPRGAGWSGTRDCMARAVKADIEVREVLLP